MVTVVGQHLSDTLSCSTDTVNRDGGNEKCKQGVEDKRGGGVNLLLVFIGTELVDQENENDAESVIQEWVDWFWTKVGSLEVISHLPNKTQKPSPNPVSRLTRLTF